MFRVTPSTSAGLTSNNGAHATASAAAPRSMSASASSRSTVSRRWTRPGSSRRGCRSRCASCSRTCCATRTASRSRKRTSARWPSWDPKAEPASEIAFMPARVLLQDFTGVPAVVDLAAMRDAMKALGGDPTRINPLLAGRAGHRSLGAGRRVRQRPGAVAERADRVLRATRSATPSCAGGSRRSATSRSCRPTPASSTR